MNYKVPDAPNKIAFTCYGCGDKVTIPYSYKENYTRTYGSGVYKLCNSCIYLTDHAALDALKWIRER